MILQSSVTDPVPAASPRRVIFVLLPGVNLLDLGGPAQVFDVAQRFGAAYDLHFCAATPQIQSIQGLPLGPLAPFPEPRHGDLVVIPGPRLDDPVAGQPWITPTAVAWLRSAYGAGAQLASVCTGLAALGEAGLLDGRRCTTHWGSVQEMQARYPKALLQDAVLYTHEGQITTSAGIASGIDMALSLLEREYGPAHSLKGQGGSPRRPDQRWISCLQSNAQSRAAGPQTCGPRQHDVRPRPPRRSQARRTDHELGSPLAHPDMVCPVERRASSERSAPRITRKAAASHRAPAPARRPAPPCCRCRCCARPAPPAPRSSRQYLLSLRHPQALIHGHAARPVDADQTACGQHWGRVLSWACLSLPGPVTCGTATLGVITLGVACSGFTVRAVLHLTSGGCHEIPRPVHFHAGPDPMIWLRPLLLTTLCLSACAGKPQVQPQQTQIVTPKAAASSAPSMKATLLAVAQTDETLRERPFCPLSVIGKQGIDVSRADYASSEKYQAWIQQQFKLIPTTRYLKLLNHATNPASPTPPLCLGTAHLNALTNLRQTNPDKFMADAPLTPTLDAWVTPEIMKLFGPSRNHPVYVPLTLIFLRSGDTWTVERL